MRPGTPTTVAPGGTDLTTTEPEPILAPSPMVMAPKMVELEPTMTRFPKGGMAFLFFKCGAAQHNTFINQAVVADLGGLSNHHTHSMVDKESPADLCARMDFDSCEPPIKMGDQAGSGIPSFFDRGNGQCGEARWHGDLDNREESPHSF